MFNKLESYRSKLCFYLLHFCLSKILSNFKTSELYLYTCINTGVKYLSAHAFWLQDMDNFVHIKGNVSLLLCNIHQLNLILILLKKWKTTQKISWMWLIASKTREVNSKYEKLVGFIRFADLDWNRIINFLKHLLEQSSKLIEHSVLIEELSFSTPIVSYAKLLFLQLSQIWWKHSLIRL